MCKEVKVSVYGRKDLTLNVWGKTTLLLDLLYRQGLLPECSIYSEQGTSYSGYLINGIKAGETEEEVTTTVWLMAESYEAEGHIDYLANQVLAERALEAGEC